MTFNPNRIINRIDQRVTNSFEQNLKEKLVNIEKAVKLTQSKVFKMMSRMIVNSSGAPALGGDTPVWRALNTRYKTRKSSSGFSENFFERTGKLGTELNKLSSESILGTPIVQLLNPNGNVTSIITRRSSRVPITRSKTGRLTKLSVTKGNHKIIVNPYPNINESLSSNIDEFKYLPTLMAHKLHSVGRPRPIFTQFLRWYSRTQITLIIRRSL